jgi:peptide/nickel transport system ATP-binding protein
VAAQIIVSVKDLHITFGDKNPFVAVNKISFDIANGKTLAIVGESGSGKSITALALMGLLPKNAHVQGSIQLYTNNERFELRNLHDKSWQQIRGKAIGMVFQEPMSSLNPVMKIGRQLTESISTHQPLTREQAKQQAIDWLRKVQLPNPEKIYDRYPHQLSGGQKQRVMIAMAMCNKPVLLIADEPTTALDVTVQKEIIHLMNELQREHDTAMIFITHDLALAAETADDVLVMYRGDVMEYGEAKQVLHDPQHPYTKALVACKPSPEQKGKRLPIVADFMEPDRKQVDINADLPSVNVTNDVLLEVQDLQVWFAEEKNIWGKPLSYFKAVKGVSFTMRKGEVLGLVGESGCGKSTVSRSLMGLLPVHEGQMIFDGKDLAKLSPRAWQRVRRDIQMIFQDPFASLNPRMTIGDMLAEPMRKHGIVPAKEIAKEGRRLLDLVQLPANAIDRYPHEFSGGQRQRVGIARALALRPKLMICDESVSALDVSVQAQILNLLKELQHEFQLSYLFISHDLSVVHYISDRVMVMQAGEIVESGAAGQILLHPQHPYTRRLIDAMPELK